MANEDTACVSLLELFGYVDDGVAGGDHIVDDNDIFLMRLYQQFADCAQFAFEDLKPCTFKIARGIAERISFNRRYEMKDGSYAGSNFGDFNVGIKDYATNNDPEMRLVKIDREDEEKADILGDSARKLLNI